MSDLSIRTISADEHAAYIASQPSASFLQTPGWAAVKSEWKAESLGWFDPANPAELLGAGLVLYRQMPKVKRYLAYLPEGPVIDWDAVDLGRYLRPLAAHLQEHGAFGVRMGPPVATRRWGAKTIKDAIAGGQQPKLGDVRADVIEPSGATVATQLRTLGWKAPRVGDGFAAGQPQYVFQVPLAGRSQDDLLKGMNQLWRRNIKKAEKAGVEVTQGGAEDLKAFHALYVETAERDHFTPRPLPYFMKMQAAMANQPAECCDFRIYNAYHQGDLVASTIWVRVGGHSWYSYGASSTAKRDVRGSNAIQWRMMSDALAAGASVYDLRGITDTLDPNDPHVGLIQFKVGTGGEAVEYVGEWDLPLNKALYTAFDLYMRRR
ncbi:lipid II:glycine glycyltransferase (peptidoglycan interpeptide bridge formation enzyme) [Kribbella steppae]|uniref:Lipid II:glycine glycyltransferase (Peptidoglycan interpeptide bridge formation enzyme) n=1 Tax=Kribbella steppae TaxID=2512223 RepID=A0A4R2HBB9_9ACTN|nr:peptidoglycan bridge formation glycyltransferase FemA/FemB family protein [Kribbella steppae]TCO24644.1 lipid II:glycine glycyltransferase (peptidoglycan interpeptide bridge formation enzyme) [Kribbella steppae]